jgi:hypothetical protein
VFTKQDAETPKRERPLEVQHPVSGNEVLCVSDIVYPLYGSRERHPLSCPCTAPGGNPGPPSGRDSLANRVLKPLRENSFRSPNTPFRSRNVHGRVVCVACIGLVKLPESPCGPEGPSGPRSEGAPAGLLGILSGRLVPMRVSREIWKHVAAQKINHCVVECLFVP